MASPGMVMHAVRASPSQNMRNIPALLVIVAVYLGVVDMAKMEMKNGVQGYQAIRYNSEKFPVPPSYQMNE
jgi:hypothetical protein